MLPCFSVRLRHLVYLTGVVACPQSALVETALVEAARAEETPSAVFGQYSGAGCGRDSARSDPPCLSAAASDQVQLSRNFDGSANVTVRLVFGQGNACQLDGVADWRDGAFVTRREGLEGGCELVIRIKGTMAILEDQGGRCQPVYCGARGAFTGARFVKRR
jgi:hypothetical protein